MTTATKISIYQDGIFAGCGDYANETIQNCAAQFCDDNDESMDVYAAIEQAINLGESKLKIEFADGSKHTYTWDLVSESVAIPDGVYFLHPEGSAWIAVEFEDGEIIDRTEESNADTHSAANDSWADVVPGDDDSEASSDIAKAIVQMAMGDDTEADMVVVTKCK